MIELKDILSGLSASDAEAVMKMAQDRTYAATTQIYTFGEHQRGLYVAKRGLIEEFRLTEAGDRLPISRIAPGQLFGVSVVNGHYCCFAEALEETVAGLLSFEKLEGVFRDYPKVAVNLVRLLAQRFGEMEERLELLAFRGLRARVAWALLGLSAIHGPVLASITHEALATWAMGSRARVSEVLEELQQTGVLRLTRGGITISDPTRLEEWAKQATAR